MKIKPGDIVMLRAGSVSAHWFKGLGPFKVYSLFENGENGQSVTLYNLDGSRAHHLRYQDDAFAHDCYVCPFMNAAKRAIEAEAKHDL